MLLLTPVRSSASATENSGSTDRQCSVCSGFPISSQRSRLMIRDYALESENPTYAVSGVPLPTNRRPRRQPSESAVSLLLRARCHPKRSPRPRDRLGDIARAEGPRLGRHMPLPRELWPGRGSWQLGAPPEEARREERAARRRLRREAPPPRYAHLHSLMLRLRRALRGSTS